MLSIRDTLASCGRREFLRIGGLALGSLTLRDLLSARAAAVQSGRPVRDKSVIFLFMHGGPSQTETFDPKMTAPAGVRSATGEVATTLPGVTFGGTLPKLARLADKLCVVRSFTTGDGKHDIKPIVCRDTLGANMGSIYSRVAGTSHPRTGMPTNAVLFPQAVDASTQPANLNFGNFAATSAIGSAYAPFVPGGGADLQQDMQLTVPVQRLDDRRHLLRGLDQIKWTLDATGMPAGIDRLREQAFSTILGGIAGAFDLSKEDARTVARYDTSRLVRPENISKKWNNYNNYVDNGKSLGRLLLLARRLCESGCGFVTVTTNFVWDMHADQNNAGVEEGMQYMGLPLDHAVSAFIEDVEARGLSDKILLVACGEMGRTPKINNSGGRDHWGGLAPLLLAGGGLQMGQVIGASTRDAGEPATDPISIRDLVATIMQTLFDVGQLRVDPRVPGELTRTITAGTPISGLL